MRRIFIAIRGILVTAVFLGPASAEGDGAPAATRPSHVHAPAGKDDTAAGLLKLLSSDDRRVVLQGLHTLAMARGGDWDVLHDQKIKDLIRKWYFAPLELPLTEDDVLEARPEIRLAFEVKVEAMAAAYNAGGELAKTVLEDAESSKNIVLTRFARLLREEPKFRPALSLESLSEDESVEAIRLLVQSNVTQVRAAALKALAGVSANMSPEACADVYRLLNGMVARERSAEVTRHMAELAISLKVDRDQKLSMLTSLQKRANDTATTSPVDSAELESLRAYLNREIQELQKAK